jgi:uncharacterized protein (TIGR03083 family)
MDASSYLGATTRDGRSLLAAAQADWGRPVPHCPAWDAAGLVRHMGRIFAWMAAIVTSGAAVDRRGLPPAPEDPADLAGWYLAQLDAVVAVLAAAEGDADTWTFSSTGDRRVAWWHRRVAVEVAIHRWDAHHAAAEPGGPPAAPIDADVAVAGVDEFLGEFLPGLLAREAIIRPEGTLHLGATDGPEQWWIDLDAGGARVAARERADSEVQGTRSGLLLWLTNRGPLDDLVVAGDTEVGERWVQLGR